MGSERRESEWPRLAGEERAVRPESVIEEVVEVHFRRNRRHLRQVARATIGRRSVWFDSRPRSHSRGESFATLARLCTGRLLCGTGDEASKGFMFTSDFLCFILTRTLRDADSTLAGITCCTVHTHYRCLFQTQTPFGGNSRFQKNSG